MTRSATWKRWYLETLAPYGSRIIYQAGDSYGPVRVVDLGPYRALYFDSPSCQGRVHRSRPWIPASDYIVSMAFGAALCEPLERCLVLGLGPGAILHTLRRMSPELKVDSVELRAQVLDIARDLFDTPQGVGVRHVVGDAAQFLRQHKLDIHSRIVLWLAPVTLTA